MLGGDPDVVEAGRTVLMGAGYTVAMAHDLRDVLALWDHFQPDLLFVDVLTRTLAEGERLAAAARRAELQVPILILATVGRRAEFFICAGDGTVAPSPDFLEKPMEPAALVDNVRHLLAQAEASPAG